MSGESILLIVFSWIIPFHEATRGNLVWKYSCGRDGGLDASGCMRHCRVDHGHCHSQWKETKGLAVGFITVPSFPGPVEPISESIEVEKKKPCHERQPVQLLMLQVKEEKIKNFSKVVKGGPLEPTFPRPRRVFPWNQGGTYRSSTAEHWEEMLDSSVHPPQNGEKNQKGPKKWWQGFGGRFGFKHGRSLFIIWEVAQAL